MGIWTMSTSFTEYEREGFESGCGAGFGARTSVAKLNIVSATHNNLVADTFS